MPDPTFWFTLVDSEDGMIARIEHDGRGVDIPADDVMLVAGKLHIALPMDVEVPVGAVTVVRHLPPTRAELRLAIEGLDPLAIEALMIDEQDTSPGEPFGVIVRRALSRAMLMEVPSGR